ncbi:MAG: 50S ribosomal protein L9 [bacterium]
MKVIFIKNVPRVGKIDEIKEQPDGYVRNFLLPKKLAILATPEAIKKLEHSKSQIKVGREVQTDLFKKNLQAVDGMTVTIKAKTNDQGSLFKAIHEKDITDALKKEYQVIIAPEYVHIHSPIKQNGTFPVIIEAMGIKETITVNVIRA